MQEPSTVSVEDMPLGEDTADMEDYATLSKLLQEFASISSIEKAWIAKSENGLALICLSFNFHRIFQ